MSTDWITEVLRDLVRFAQQNRMMRLARDLEQALQGLDEEKEKTVPMLGDADTRPLGEDDSDHAAELSPPDAH